MIVNAGIRREWYRKLNGKEPDRDLSLAEMEEAVPFRLPDMSDIDAPAKSAGITHLVHATVVFTRQDLISIQWHEFDFYGAESWPISHHFETYDLVTGKQVMLDEMLEPGYDARLAKVITEAYQNSHHAPGQREAMHRNFGKIPFERDRGNLFVTAEGSIGFGYDFMEQPYHASSIAKVPIQREDRAASETELRPRLAGRSVGTKHEFIDQTLRSALWERSPRGQGGGARWASAQFSKPEDNFRI